MFSGLGGLIAQQALGNYHSNHPNQGLSGAQNARNTFFETYIQNDRRYYEELEAKQRQAQQAAAPAAKPEPNPVLLLIEE